MGQASTEQLLAVFESLQTADQAAVLAFAEFLSSRSGGVLAGTALSDLPVPVTPEPVPDPEPIPRPDDERVVAAVKRLSKTYFMLDKRVMLNVTSDLVTQHIMQGREASAVIDELEELFREQYELLKAGEA